MNPTEFNWKIGGKAGEGIAATGFMMGKIAQRHGLHVFEYGEYPSLIRGGHTTSQVFASTDATVLQKKSIDILVVLNEETLKNHVTELTATSKILIDTDDDKIDFSTYPTIRKEQIVAVPLVKLSRDSTGKSLASNVVALAVTCHMLGLSIDIFKQVLREFFHDKGEEMINENIKACEYGYTFAVQSTIPAASAIAPLPSDTLFITGSEAIAMGALSAGVQYYAAYPMTPTSNLMHIMAGAQANYPLVVKHAEDEIAAINDCLGASFAGVRAMTGTAGGGFALMVEAVSLAGVTELPLVVVVGMRPGPATGLPTWTGQADLEFVMHAGHGEFPRIVFTPGDLVESFKLTRLGFILAEKYHTQVYIISDKLLLESRMTGPIFDEEFTNTRYSFATDPLPEDNSYRRFIDTPEGYSPRSVPGLAHGLQLTNSYEHDAYGYAIEDAETAKIMNEKRMRKWQGIAREVPAPLLIGPTEADVTLVCWGSTKLVVTDVVERMNAITPNSVNAIHLMTMVPFGNEAFTTLASKAKKLVMIEGNAMHQGANHIRAMTGISIEHHINRYDGRPFYTEDVIEEIQKLTI